MISLETSRYVSGQKDGLLLTGTAKPFLYCHGDNGSRNNLMRYPEFELAKRCSDFGVGAICGDMDGSPAATTHAWANPTSVANAYTLLTDALDAFGVTTPVPGVGTSAGWITLCAIEHNHPGTFSCMVGLVPVSHMQAVYEASKASNDIVSGYMRTAHTDEATLYSRFPTLDPIAIAHELTLPTLIVGGTEDVNVPQSYLEAYVAAVGTNAELLMVPGVHGYLPAATDAMATFIAGHV